MKYNGNKAEEIKIAYIGGGSRGWAWGLMQDLAACDDISGDIYLYDIDYEAAKNNELVGNKNKNNENTKSIWNYHASKTAKEAMAGADFVIISILPGTFDEMESDVHTPEKYGIYQPVGDTAGPGGTVRAMRSIPMFEEIARNVKEYCPDAWVINYTNPMTLCTKALFNTFPEIKAFGCCHEVFGTQTLLSDSLSDICGISDVDRNDIKVNPISVNHFTWLTEAKYKNIDLFPIYKEFVEKYKDTGYNKIKEKNWMEKLGKEDKINPFHCDHRVKFDLFEKYGYIAAAGDRHLAEFCPGKWYLKDPETVHKWGFALTPVSWRKEDLKERLARSQRLINGEEQLEIKHTNEEGYNQIRALLGLCDLVTNVNIPNVGQIPNLPLGAVVETNAIFRSDSITPVMAGEIPASIYPLISRVCGIQEELSDAIAKRDVERIFNAFSNDPLVTCSKEEARELFKEMVENTKEYLTDFDLSNL